MILEDSMRDWLRAELDRQKGNVSCLYRNLVSGDCFGYRTDHVHPSASIIKMFLMADIYDLAGRGRLLLTDRISVEDEKNASSSGVLHFMKDIKSMSVRDLVELMIIISDNTATNILLRIEGMEQMQRYLKDTLKLNGTRWNREMMDLDAIARGIQNYTSADDCAWLLEQIYRGRLVSPEASAQMLQILKEQQFNDLIPEDLCDLIPEENIAHKTGGLDGVVHDTAIVDYGKEPFILCFLGSETDVPEFSRLIRRASLKIYQAVNGPEK
ncbi:MAG: serine hydrolase [Lachnospiraceae bacterium]|nr:serine hydrolase [Lachnospiraceae bacterium]